MSRRSWIAAFVAVGWSWPTAAGSSPDTAESRAAAHPQDGGRAEIVRASGEAARAFVERFCAADLNADAERYERAMWTQPSDDPERGVFIATWNPFAVVTSCRVSAADVRGSAAKASLRCSRIGRSDGDTAIAAESPTTEAVVLSLRREKGRWWVVDPPPPRVHIDAAIKEFEADLARYPVDWEARGTAALNRGRERVAAGLAALRELRGKLSPDQLSPKNRAECK